MTIGLLAFHYAVNFGAALQLSATYRHLTAEGHNVRVINYVPQDAEDYYAARVPLAQQQLFRRERQAMWQETRLCRNSQEVAAVLNEEGIEAVIIGSDAVSQCHTLLERIVFPTKKIVHIRAATTVERFPNAYWGEFNAFLPQPVPVALLSASSQDSRYKYFSPLLRRRMRKAIEAMHYVSVRDTWTQQMMAHITAGTLVPPVTPDPVFALNAVAENFLPTKEEIKQRYNLPEKYVVLSFINERMVTQEWVDTFREIMERDYHTPCLSLPFAHKAAFGTLPSTIPLPLSARDWYAIIAASNGYVGNNMHPIIVAIANSVPFFAFDNYGLTRWNKLTSNDTSSKIKDLLDSAGLATQRLSCLNRTFRAPAAASVAQRLTTCPTDRERAFAERRRSDYHHSLADILRSLHP